MRKAKLLLATIIATATVSNPMVCKAEMMEDANDLRNYQYTQAEWSPTYFYYWGEVLNPALGRIVGPSGVETYYNLPMEGVIGIMKSEGFDYPFWVREDGVKMYGDYIMVAADLSIRPRGSIVKTSLGAGIVCDTGAFIYSDPYQIDIATAW